jgi:hypothetical protein
MGIYGYIFPLGIGLGISRLPREMTIGAMLAAAGEAARANSHEEAEREIKRLTRIKVSGDTLRAVANELGALVHANDLVSADETIGRFSAPKPKFPETKRSGALCLERGGAVTAGRKEKGLRAAGAGGPIGKEVRLGPAFSSGSAKYRETGQEKNTARRERGSTPPWPAAAGNFQR